MRRSFRGNPWHDEYGRFCSGPKGVGSDKCAVGIEWDTDGEEVDLPSEVEIPKDVSEEDMADYLSDKYGWCVKSLGYITKSERSDSEYRERAARANRRKNPPPKVDAYVVNGNTQKIVHTDKPQKGMIVEYDPSWCRPEEEKYLHVVSDMWTDDNGNEWADIKCLNSMCGSHETVELEMIRPASREKVDSTDY